MTNPSPLLLPYGDTEPELGWPALHTGPGAAILGRATIGHRSWFGARAVVRADGHYVQIGNDFRLGPRGTVHISHDVYPTHIGDGVTAGRNAVIHACDVGEGCHIGHDVVILDGSQVAPGTAIADGAVVFPRTQLEGGWLYAGRPAKALRRLEPGELERLHAASREEADETIAETGGKAPEPADRLFLAATAWTTGRVRPGAGVGIWYGCALDAGRHEIAIGENTNIQDNTTILCREGPVSVGRESTFGHNVMATDCQVGDRSLIGIGAVLEPGTVVEDDVLVAAGARTEPGQRLESGWLYGGTPARKLSELDQKRRMMITGTWMTYLDYGEKFRLIQESRLGA